MSLDKKRQHWLDADDNEVYASELRTAAAVYIFGLETALATETKRADKAEAELEALKARHCVNCTLAFTDCPRAIELLDGGGQMDIDFCSEWTPREAAE